MRGPLAAMAQRPECRGDCRPGEASPSVDSPYGSTFPTNEEAARLPLIGLTLNAPELDCHEAASCWPIGLARQFVTARLADEARAVVAAFNGVRSRLDA